MTHATVNPPAQSALHAPRANQLIASLPPKDRKQLLALCKPVQLTLGDILCDPGDPTRHAHFPVDAFVSMIATSSLASRTGQRDPHGGISVEVGMVGNEGMVGAELVLGVAVSPLRAHIQGGGLALRIDRSDFKRQLASSDALQRRLQRYVYVLMAQQATAANCLRFHLISQRLARWLLMSQDRAHSDHFSLTQEFLAHMLGVRRVGITAAAGTLQRQGFIAYHRGELQVLDRTGLEAAACSCYQADKRTYNTVL